MKDPPYCLTRNHHLNFFATIHIHLAQQKRKQMRTASEHLFSRGINLQYQKIFAKIGQSVQEKINYKLPNIAGVLIISGQELLNIDVTSLLLILG